METANQKCDFNALVTACAGQDRESQEKYLVCLVMKLLIERYERDPKLPDANVLRKHGIGDIKNVHEAQNVLDAYYLAVSRALLDDASDDPCCIRDKAIEYMRSYLSRRQEIRKEAGV